jgi:apolipoprotein N-acyltransferase
MGLTGSIIVTLLFVIAVSIPYIIIALFHKPIHKNNIYNINVIAVLFLIAEYIKSLLFGGFPWLLVSISQNETIFNFIYPVFGSYMVTYMVVLSAMRIMIKKI